LNIKGKMKEDKYKIILFVAWYFYPKVGGVETMLLNQARYFVNTGYKIIILTSSSNNLPAEEYIYGIKVIRREYMRGQIHTPTNQIKDDFSAILEKYHPKIVHFHNGSYPAGVKDRSIGVEVIKNLFKIAKEHGTSIIEHAHNAQIKQPEITKPLRELPWDFVICVSKFVKERWLKLGTRAKNIEVVYNGIDLLQYENAKPNSKIAKIKQPNNFLIFFPARVFRISSGEIGEQKNFMLVLKACRKLNETSKINFKLLAVSNHKNTNSSDRQSEKILNKIIGEYKLEDKIVFVPPISPDEMPNYYAGVDVVCAPSINETFGLVYLEAMAAGAIAIASNTGGPREYIKNGENGFLVDPKDETALAKLFFRLSHNDFLTKKIKYNARLTAKMFLVKHMCKEIERIYNKILIAS